jgi:Rne/Rng family ribonuclease
LSREILIQTQKEERLVAIIENGRVEDFYIEVDRFQSLLGNIYKGKVESILPSINAAFVNIGQGRNGFLYLTDAVNPLFEEEISGTRKFIVKFLETKRQKLKRNPSRDVEEEEKRIPFP